MKLILLFAASTLLAQDTVQAIFDRAIADFNAGRIAESIKGFDQVATAVPDQAPHLWQRGIALYYAGRYADCRRQFESHREVNPNDVENAAWHYLCVAREQSPAKARAALLPVGPDDRAPMSEIYRMFRGELQPADVLTAASSQRTAQFYALLYMGLYYEAQGDKARAKQNLKAAAGEQYKIGGYMHSVARVHVQRME